MNCKLLVFQLAAAAMGLLLVGCGDRDDIRRVVVSGAVKFHGAPVEDGQIRFIPQSGTVGPITIEAVSKGKYTCRRKGGVPVGQHRVEILSYHPDDPDPKGPGEPGRRQLLPEKYNRASQLSCTVEEQSGPLTKDFDLNGGT